MKFATARGALACSNTTVTIPWDVVMSASKFARAALASNTGDKTATRDAA